MESAEIDEKQRSSEDTEAQTLEGVRGMVLAAGHGTRMGPLSNLRPKPLLPVCGVPLVRYSLAQMAEAGVKDVVVNLHHLGEKVREEIGEAGGPVERVIQKAGEEEEGGSSGPYGLDVYYSAEEGQILGTGGGVSRVREFFDGGTFIVANGKIVSCADLGRAVEFHRRMGALATMVVRTVEDPYSWGAVECGAKGWIQSIAGVQQAGRKLGGDRVPVRAYVFTGIHVMEPEFLDILPEGPSCIVRDGYFEHLRKGSPIAGYVDEAYWHDHSTPSRYLQGNLNVLNWQAGLHENVGFPDLFGVDPAAEVSDAAGIVAPVRICAGAKVAARARIGPGTVLGPGASVGTGRVVANSVVWKDTEVNRDVVSAIVTPQGIYPVDLSEVGAKTGPGLRR